MLIRPVYRPKMPSLALGLACWLPCTAGTISGNAALDLATQTRDTGTLNSLGASTWRGGPPGVAAYGPWGRNNTSTSLKFDGSASYIDLGTAPTFGPTTNDFTVTAWTNFSIDPAANDPVCNWRASASTTNPGFDCLILSTTGNLFTVFCDGSAPRLTGSATTNIRGRGWTHVGWVFRRSSNCEMYVNGVVDGTVAISAQAGSVNASASSNFTLGADIATPNQAPNRFAVNQYGHFRFYNRALSKGEMLALYAEAFQPQMDIETIALMHGTFGGGGDTFATGPSRLIFI